MATTEELKNGGSTSYNFSIEYIKPEDIKVEIDGSPLTYTTNTNPSSGEYKVVSTTVTLGAAAAAGSGNVHIYRHTDLDSPAAVFAAGSAIRAQDLNDCHDLVRLASQEQHQLIRTPDLKDSSVTSAKIKDLTIVDADIAAGAEIEVYKLKDGGSNQVLVTQSDGTTVGWSSSVDLGGTLDVTGNVDFDANLNVDGTLTVAGAADLNGDLDVDGTTNLDNTNVAGYLNVVGTANVDNVFIDGNTVETLSGGLTLNSFNGSTTIDDNLNVTGTSTINNVPVVTTTGTQTLTNKTLTTPVINDMSGTAVVTSGTSNSDNKVYSAKRAEERFYGKDTVGEIQSGETWSSADDKVATTAAIDARIIDLVDDVGGFVPIANETSFPTTNPDINTSGSSKGGTIVSVKTASTNLVPSGSTVTIANGRGSGLAVIITGVPSTIPSGFGFLVETTATDHTYAFHRLTPKATEVTTVAGIASNITSVANNTTNINAVASNETNINAVKNNETNINTVAGKATEIGRLGTADAVADMAILGTADVVADLNTLGTADVVADMNMLATSDVVADMNMLAVSDVISDMDALATNDNITAMDTCRDNITSIINASTNISSANNFGDQYQVAANNPSTDGGGNALAAGDLYFNTSANELKVYNGSSWQGGVTASGSFAATTGNTFTGDNRYNDGVKALFGTGSDIEIHHSSGQSYIQNSTGNFRIDADALRLRSKTNSEAFLSANVNGAVELYYDNSKKLETTSGGGSLTGDWNVSNDFFWVDNGEAVFGTGGDLKIYHDGTDSHIHHAKGYPYNDLKIRSSGDIQLQTNNTEDAVVCRLNGAVELYHNNSKKFETTSSGAVVTGSLGIGTSSPSYKLHVTASDYQVARFESTNANADGAYIELVANSSSPADNDVLGILNYKGNNDASGLITYSQIRTIATDVSDGSEDGDITFHTRSNGTFGERVRINSSGHVKIVNDSAELQIGAGNDLRLYHNGTDSVIDTDTGNLYLNSAGGIYITPNNNEAGVYVRPNGAVELYYDNSKKFETMSTGAYVEGYLAFPDNGGLKIGSGNDLQIYHDSATPQNLINSYTSNPLTIMSNGNTSIKSNNGDNMGVFKKDGAVELYYDNSKKFETNSGGCTLTGTLTTTSGINAGNNISLTDNFKLKLGTGDDLQIYHDGSNSYLDDAGTGSLYLRGSASIELRKAGSTEKMLYAEPDAQVELYYDNSKKLETQSWGTSFTGNVSPSADNQYDLGASGAQWNDLYIGNNIYLPDAGEVRIGNSGDLQLYHDGNNSYINDTGTGRLKLQSNVVQLRNSSNTETVAEFIENGSNDLYYDNSKKAETTGTGFQINGHLDMHDGHRIRLGDSTDIEIFHNGTSNHIDCHTAGQELYIRPAGDVYIQDYFDDQKHIKMVKDGGVELYHNNSLKAWTVSSGLVAQGNITPYANNLYDLGSASYRWANLYVNDMHFANSPENVNCVDGTWGDWTLQEGEETIYMLNNRNGKKYKMALQEVS